MLKVKIGGELQNFFYLWDKTFEYWWEVLCFLLLALACYIFGKPFFSGRLLSNIRLSSFLFGLEFVSVGLLRGGVNQ
jgi:hypothetical protein